MADCQKTRLRVCYAGPDSKGIYMNRLTWLAIAAVVSCFAAVSIAAENPDADFYKKAAEGLRFHDGGRSQHRE